MHIKIKNIITCILTPTNLINWLEEQFGKEKKKELSPEYESSSLTHDLDLI